MKCIECGHELKDGAIFCIRCGAMQVSMDGSPLEKQEWPEVEPQSDGSGWRSSADGSRPSANAQHSRDFTPAPQRGGGRIVAIVIAVIVVLAIVAFAAFQCMAPAASGGDEGSATTTSSESGTTSDSAASASSASTSASATAASSAAASSSSASDSAESASASSANDQAAATEETPTIVGEQTQAQPQQAQPQQAQPQATAPAAPVPSAGDYVLADSSTRAYSQGELEAMSTSDLYYARNEIFARHGRMFQRADLQDYFNSKSWYNPQYSPEQWNNLPNQLNSTEIANANLMMQVERSKGSPYL